MHMKKIGILILGILLFQSCKKDDDEPVVATPMERTVLVYISGENNLSGYIADELDELKEGSKGIGNNALVVYVDKKSSYEKPYIMRIKEGEAEEKYYFGTDSLSSHPEVMARVLKYTSDHYPATDYGLVLWGHASGWVLEDSVEWSGSRMRGYGHDSGTDGNSLKDRYINMNTLARVLTAWNKPIRFILADCCQFQCIESAYELRHTTDYIIGSPAEIPGVGAPYHTMTPYMFSQADDFYREIVDAYYAQKADNKRVLLSVIKTSTIPALAAATNQALKTFALPTEACPDLRKQRLIYYRKQAYTPLMYDMNDFMLHNAPQQAYETWKQALDQVVIYKTYTPTWVTSNQINFNDFEMSEERYGGISMFVPQALTSYAKYNKDIQATAWYWAAGLNEVGW